MPCRACFTARTPGFACRKQKRGPPPPPTVSVVDGRQGETCACPAVPGRAGSATRGTRDERRRRRCLCRRARSEKLWRPSGDETRRGGRRWRARSPARCDRLAGLRASSRLETKPKASLPPSVGRVTDVGLGREGGGARRRAALFIAAPSAQFLPSLAKRKTYRVRFATPPGRGRECVCVCVWSSPASVCVSPRRFASTCRQAYCVRPWHSPPPVAWAALGCVYAARRPRYPKHPKGEKAPVRVVTTRNGPCTSSGLTPSPKNLRREGEVRIQRSTRAEYGTVERKPSERGGCPGARCGAPHRVTDHHLRFARELRHARAR
ncbi:hypothetical protein BC628DRAFT_343971 [Trametes gibbosa]|nr:hypothetical protein BC628DRAFT_343971 [Trametes gibbosa]